MSSTGTALRATWDKITTHRFISLIVLIAAVYLGFGIYLAATYSDWKVTDTYSLIGFFAIGTLLAVIHEIMLDAVNDDMRGVKHVVLRISDQLETGEALLRFSKAPVEVEKPSLSPSGPDDSMAIPGAPAPFPEVGADDDTGEIYTVADLVLPNGSEQEKQKILDRFALDAVLEVGTEEVSVQKLLKKAPVFVLGHPADDTESDILVFTADDAEGVEHVFMPLWTRREPLRDALLRNPDWQSLLVLAVSGGELMENRDHDVTLVINPWSPFEFQLPPMSNIG